MKTAQTVATVLISTIIVIATSSAQALTAGTYRCPGRGPVPENVYVIKKVNLGGLDVPFMEITRHFAAQVEGAFETAVVKGFATESTYRGRTSLTIGSISVDIAGDNSNMSGCTFTPEN